MYPVKTVAYNVFFQPYHVVKLFSVKVLPYYGVRACVSVSLYWTFSYCIIPSCQQCSGFVRFFYGSASVSRFYESGSCPTPSDCYPEQFVKTSHYWYKKKVRKAKINAIGGQREKITPVGPKIFNVLTFSEKYSVSGSGKSKITGCLTLFFRKLSGYRAPRYTAMMNMNVMSPPTHSNLLRLLWLLHFAH